ncbi:MMPL family transporter [Tessaracoccus lubricantis]|uniref:MMPL family transporter n=1 Tax=Tessaracoccus lubricantis TaxID=545543 RepID=A0ABP9F171_9ACTN
MSEAPAPEVEPRRGFMARLWYGYARVTVALRWVIVVGWVAAAIAATLFLPPMQGTVDDIEALGADDASFAAEKRSLELFEFPLLSRAAIVQRNPEGLPPLVQAEAVMRGIAVTQRKYDTPLLGAIPVPNAEAAFPGAGEKNTTVITYVFADPQLNFFEQTRAVEDFAAEQLTDPSDAYVGVTGSIPARAAQGLVLNSYVHIVEVVTVLAVLTIMALTFGSLIAPLLTLISVGAAVFVTLGVSGWVAGMMDVSIPADLRPLIVALLLGIVTDYCIFYLSGLRTRLREGHSRLEAARLATASFTPIVTVAGVTVAAGTASLLVAESPLFRGFGPALALTVLTGLVVAVTLVPALLAILGRGAFWPRTITPEPVRARKRPSLLTRAVANRASALVLVLVCVAGLGAAAYQARHLDLGLGFVQSLPETTSAQRAEDAAGKGFAPGIISPTEIVVEAPGVGEKADEVAQLGEALKTQPGVAGVIGPGDLPAADDVGAFTAKSGEAVRFLVVLDSTPLEATAIDTLRNLEAELPQLASDAGLGEVTTHVGGDTALASGVIADTTNDLFRIGIVALAVNLLLLVVFLRALIAPLYLLASSVLALGATLGLSVLFFQDFLGHDDQTFYVPFAGSVLLLSLGSDYNIFAVGHVWQEARNRPMREAILVATPESNRAITSAGLALAASFGLLALVPLGPFRELGFLLGVGILIDVFIVRALLVPSLITLVGPVSSWPSGILRRERRARDRTARARS